MTEKTTQTVLGPVAPDELGFTSMHEHVMFYGAVLGKRLRREIPENALPLSAEDKVSLANVGMLLNNSIMSYDALIQDDIDVMVRECMDFKKSGASALLELSVPGLSINMSALKEISLRSGLHIIASTGFYTWDSWPENYYDKPLSFYKRHMEDEIKYGISGTDIKPGSLKIALNDLNEMEERALRAAGQICAETGLPLTVHPCEKAGGDRLQVVKILKEEGVSPSKIVLAHSKTEHRPTSFAEVMYHPDAYYVTTEELKRLFDTGVNLCFELQNPLGFEMMGQGHYGELGKIAGLYEVLKEGYEAQIVLGNDVCGRTMLAHSGGMGYLRLTTFLIPVLMEAGISQRTIDRITKYNPAEILAV